MTQLTLTLEQGISVRHRSLRECMAAGVYQRGLTRVAGQIDMAPSKLSEKLSGGNGDRHRDVGLDDLERYLHETGDVAPIHYLVEKYLGQPDVVHSAALAQIAALQQQQLALMQQLGVTLQPQRKPARSTAVR
jgi:hypothetical protein